MPILQIDNFITLHKVASLDSLDGPIKAKLSTTPIAGTGAVSYQKDYKFLEEYYSDELGGAEAIGGAIPMIAEIQGHGMKPFLMSVMALFKEGRRDAPLTGDGEYVVGMCPTAFDYEHYPANFSIATHSEHVISSAEKVSLFYQKVDLSKIKESVTESILEGFTTALDTTQIPIGDAVMERAIQLTNAAGIKADNLNPAKHLVGRIPNWHEASNLLIEAGVKDKMIPSVEFILGFPGRVNPYE